MAGSGLAFGCTCGTVTGHIAGAGPRTGTHIICHCRDCRAAELYFEQPDPGGDGVEVYQTTSDAVTFDSGQDALGLLRLGPKGVMRWYATCCNAPLFNTLSKPKLAFATLILARAKDPSVVGPIVARSFVPTPGGAPKHKGAALMVWRIFTRLGAARLSGRWRDTPFFDVDSGEPVVPAKILTHEERSTLYPDQRNTNG